MSENNDSEQGLSDITTIIDIAVRFISKNGVEYEKELFDSHPRYTFLRSSDPNHAFYKQKLIEYQNRAHDDDTDDDDVDTEIIQPPPGGVTNRILGTARVVAHKGSKAKKMIMKDEAKNANYNFMKKSDPYHAFYKLKVAEYRSKGPSQEELNDDIEPDDEALAAARLTFSQLQYIDLPNYLLHCRPHGMTLEEFQIIKLTAQFVAWYGIAFWSGLIKRDQFEFMKPTGKWFPCFSNLAVEFAKVLMPPSDMKQELINNAAYTATLVDAFLQRLQWGPAQHHYWLQGGKKALLDWHDSVTKEFFANKDENQQQLPPPLEEPDPKRLKFDESSLVPEEQFLAQLLGSTTIRVSVPNADGGQVIEITVQSLLESVASLKDKIAGEIHIPAQTLKLISGKAGVLKENDKSLAHYNVGAGDTLTLSV